MEILFSIFFILNFILQRKIIERLVLKKRNQSTVLQSFRRQFKRQTHYAREGDVHLSFKDDP